MHSTIIGEYIVLLNDVDPYVASSDSLQCKLFKYKQKWFEFTCWKHDVSTCSLFRFLFQFSFNSASTYLSISILIRNIFAYQFWFFPPLIECFFKKIHGYRRIELMQFIIISTQPWSVSRVSEANKLVIMPANFRFMFFQIQRIFYKNNSKKTLQNVMRASVQSIRNFQNSYVNSEWN